MLAKRRGEFAPAGNEQQGRAAAQVQARKDLSAMGLSYFSQEQFADAVKRGDKVVCSPKFNPFNNQWEYPAPSC